MFSSRSTQKLMDYQSKLNTSSYSNKSRGSFKETSPESRNITPPNVNRPQTARHEYTSPSKVKQLLNTLIQGDSNKVTTQLFGQSLFQKKQADNHASRGDSLLTSRVAQTNNKSPRNNENYVKQTYVTQQNFQNLYYQCNKPNDSNQSQKKNKLLTISQIAKQCKQNSQTPLKNINNENFNIINSQSSHQKQNSSAKKQQLQSVHSNTYLETFNILKQRFDSNHMQNKKTQVSQKTEKSINISPLPKTLDENQQQTIFKQLIQKESLWFEIMNNIDNPNQMTLATQCTQLQKLIRQLSEKHYSEYLFKVEQQILETFLFESYACLLLVSDYLNESNNGDQNIKNLIQYIQGSNLYVLQVLESVACNGVNQTLLKKRIDLRTCNSRKPMPKGKQALQKNNFIIKSILGLMIDDTTRPEIYVLMSHNISNLDMYLNQQKKINSFIEQMMPLDLERAVVAQSKDYTLVLDLDETLVHYQEFPTGGGQFLVRPFAEEFLEQISKYYEVFIFTAALPDYANFIIDIIDKRNVVKQRLYRDKTIFKDQVYIKDLSILNRNLAKVIIVDNMPENFQLQPENGIYIQSWFGDTKDRALKDLQPLLEQIAIRRCKDVRIALNQFREQMIERVQMGMKNPYQNLQLN